MESKTKEIIAPQNDYILELGNVMVKARKSEDEVFKVNGSGDLGDFLIDEIGFNAQEIVLILYLNVQNEVIYKQRIFAGSISEANVSIFHIIQSAVLVNAPRVVMAHNHPSNSAIEPSMPDVEFCDKLNMTLSYMNIELLDFFIVNNKEYFSFKERHEYLEE